MVEAFLSLSLSPSPPALQAFWVWVELNNASIPAMDDYTREMMDLKTLVTRTLEKKGVLARIRAELRANVFAAIEEEDRAAENEENHSFALIDTCNERAKKLHASPSGKLLTALICDYMEWCNLEHTLKVYLPECNLANDFWKSELKEKFGHKIDSGSGRDADSPLLLQVLEAYLKQEQNSTSSLSGSFTKLSVRRTTSGSENASNSVMEESQVDLERPARRQSVPLSGTLPPLGRRGGFTSLGQGSNVSAPLRNYNTGRAADHGALDTQPSGT